MLRIITNTKAKWITPRGEEDVAPDERAAWLIAPLSRAEMLKIRERHTRVIRRRHGEIEKIEDHEAFSREVYQTVVKDWRNIVDEKGEKVPFSPEALELFIDLNPLRAAEVLDASMDAEARAEDIEIKN